LKAGGTKEGCKPDGRDNWTPDAGKAPFDQPTLKPYWGKLTVRNFRGGAGNVTKGVGLRPAPKAADEPPDPKDGAPVLYPATPAAFGG
jgi:hypothetical protein